ncbi:hypothetical protein [Nocardiopsis ganjiahuensis]|uniref:hypothetical protein n=1 Tax=Nocardiopsis ganjiahuensis TaxID=239984 RepID=UPI0012694226|nr:hypothetical protein [Nocardiopsis ganjiahuensis]
MRSARNPLVLLLLGPLVLSGCGGPGADAPAPEEAVTDSGPAEEEEAGPDGESHILAPEGSDVAWRFPAEIEGWSPTEEGRENGVRFRREDDPDCALSFFHWEGAAAEVEAEGGDVRSYLEGALERLVENDGVELESVESADPVEVRTHPGGDALEFTMIRVETSIAGSVGTPRFQGAHWYGDDALTTVLTCDETGEEGYGHAWAADLLDAVTVAVD